ncbi:acyl-phosphate glycerol 3-phosphate acyltransferase [Aeromicrobium sp. PE09-221]|uniref:1-acyl-sn-glycerol-3-phosphate acyltransferase n=1 Tax=Aeromicrobium sp. PE09-221 TaxID=1898043 RepID=UPI000B6C14CB|nr:1-acyl-sn-glycerol-3-phosphate acyltransferase [Aeromicrobium sp. PE09-221]OUZ10647.1 acyl-phosphate glycerol 3-phosphate acyltransferase [Aeromicrobium sp. PE09-221]
MIIRRAVARLYWTLSRWNYRSESVPEASGVMVAAPHTSNWDFVLMVAVAWRNGLTLRFLGKRELFAGPMGPLMRAFGGIPVDRRDPAGLVEELIERHHAGESFHLVITPEGTRGPVDRWKSGFYRIARATDLPVTLAYVDRTTRTTGLGPTFRLSGDVRADMDRIRAFYAGMVGVRPANTGRVALAEEAGGASAPDGLQQ